MPTFYNFKQDGVDYSFDDVFVPADMFRDGNLWTWGAGGSGQLGTNDTTQRNTPVTIFTGGNNWKHVSCGLNHTSAIKTDGSLWIWGESINGKLGTNDTTPNRLTPVTTFAGGNDWKNVNCSRQHTVAIKTDGTLWTWGQNTRGELGTNDTTDRSTPVTTFAGGTNWKQISAHPNLGINVALKSDGTLWTWGQGSYGQLGTNDTSDRSTPVTTFAGGNNWIQVSTGGGHTAAIKTDGTLWIWGLSDHFQLGTADTVELINRSTPVTTFAGGTDWKRVSLGGGFSMALKKNGTLWTWGNGTNARLGTNDTTPKRSTPVTTFAGGNDWKTIYASINNSLAIKTDGSLWVWGLATSGRLGIDSLSPNRSTPVTTFAGGNNWKQTNFGNTHGIAITYDDPVI
jgi:alpha-tubulin suppressor-like RCC1 family protein